MEKDVCVTYVNDEETDFVYLSDQLKAFYPDTFKRLTALFNELYIDWGEVYGTKDIWIRDYMPIQITDKRYLVYDYSPDYLVGAEEYRTDSRSIFKDVLPGLSQWKNTNIKLDGGNVVVLGDCLVLTDKVFWENGREAYDNDFHHHLKDALCSDILFLPWHCEHPDDPDADVYGHADGLVRWTGGNKVLLTNHRDTDPVEAAEIIRRLERRGYVVREMQFDVPRLNRDFNWAYINYLQIGKKVIVPTFGIPEDKQALKIIQEENPDCVVRGFRMRDIASKGGALHCITWNIKR